MDDSTAKYIRQIAQSSKLRLSPTEEERLLKKRKEKRNEDDVRKIANSYLMLLVKIALSYSRYCPNNILNASDLIGEGYNGLLRAAQKFDYEQECKFSTYAVWWIRQAIILALYNHSKTIRNYYLITWQVNRFYRIRNEAAQLGKEISLEEIAEKIGVPVEKLRENIRLVYETKAISMDIPLEENQNRRNTETIEYFISDEKIPNPEEIAQIQQMKEKTRKMLLTITPREERVLRLRFGIGEKKSHGLREAGQSLKLTRERIRQIEAKALRKLRKKFTVKENSKSFDFNNYL